MKNKKSNLTKWPKVFIFQNVLVLSFLNLDCGPILGPDFKVGVHDKNNKMLFTNIVTQHDVGAVDSV